MSNEYKQIFGDLQIDFFRYMMTEGGLAKKTSSDYVSRLRFLSGYYLLDGSITEDYIDFILQQEEINRHNRTVYNSKKSMSDFSAGLHKFYHFIKSDYRKVIQESILNEETKVENDRTIPETERKAIVQSRIGQGLFRNRLITYWHGCSITGCSTTSILLASHIKPWRISNNEERLDVYNGLLLLPNYDKLFDLGYISFDSNGKIIFSNLLGRDDRKLLKLESNISLLKIEDKHKQFLKFHNENCLL